MATKKQHHQQRMDYLNDPIFSIFNGRTDFITGIENDTLDFAQLEAFIHGNSNNNNNTSSPTVTTINSNQTNLPESPPDSGSEPPYSPAAIRISNGQSTNLVEQQHQQHHQQQHYPDQLFELENLHQYNHHHNHHHHQNDDLLDLDSTAGDDVIESTNYQNLTNHNPYLSENNQNLIALTVNRKRKLINDDTTVKPELFHHHHQNFTEPVPIVVTTDLSSSIEICTNSMDSLANQIITTAASGGANTTSSSPPSIDGSTSGEHSPLQCIRFNPFQQTSWHILCDQNLQELPLPHYRVDADKGFNFSNSDDAFVCQKKNHFQITCHAQLQGTAVFVRTAAGLEKVRSFHLHFYGVKQEAPTQTIRVEQSQSDRSKKPFHPVPIDLQAGQVSKVTVGRLHFSETTTNNMRKKGRPNPEQRYFQLIVGLHAHTHTGHFPIVSQGSERIIVRASNPGQFESDVELSWQRGATNESIYHAGRVGINTDRPDESLVVHGNLKVSGHIVHPSDSRAKHKISELDTSQQLINVQKIRVVRYQYEPEFALHSGLIPGTSDTGVIAQEVQKVLPDAVHETGTLYLPNGQVIDNFLVVNKERIFMENIGAVKELCKVTGSLETRIEQLERINARLARIQKIKTQHQKMYRHHADDDDDDDDFDPSTSSSDLLCSNQMIQLIIIVLVVIMAVCLAAISTLYFVEHQKQEYNYLPAANSLLVSSRSSTTSINKFSNRITKTSSSSTKKSKHHNHQSSSNSNENETKINMMTSLKINSSSSGTSADDEKFSRRHQQAIDETIPASPSAGHDIETNSIDSSSGGKDQLMGDNNKKNNINDSLTFDIASDTNGYKSAVNQISNNIKFQISEPSKVVSSSSYREHDTTKTKPHLGKKLESQSEITNRCKKILHPIGDVDCLNRSICNSVCYHHQSADFIDLPSELSDATADQHRNNNNNNNTKTYLIDHSEDSNSSDLVEMQPPSIVAGSTKNQHQDLDCYRIHLKIITLNYNQTLDAEQFCSYDLNLGVCYHLAVSKYIHDTKIELHFISDQIYEWIYCPSVMQLNSDYLIKNNLVNRAGSDAELLLASSSSSVSLSSETVIQLDDVKVKYKNGSKIKFAVEIPVGGAFEWELEFKASIVDFNKDICQMSAANQLGQFIQYKIRLFRDCD